MAGRGGDEAPAAKEKQAGEAGWGATAAALGAQFLGGGGGEARPEEAGMAGDKQPSGASGLMGTAAHLAQGYLAGEGSAKEGAGASGGGVASMLTTAQGWLGGGEGGAAGEGGHKADPGLVDKLLGMYAQTQGKPVSVRLRTAGAAGLEGLGRRVREPALLAEAVLLAGRLTAGFAFSGPAT